MHRKIELHAKIPKQEQFSQVEDDVVALKWSVSLEWNLLGLKRKMNNSFLFAAKRMAGSHLSSPVLVKCARETNSRCVYVLHATCKGKSAESHHEWLIKATIKRPENEGKKIKDS